MGQHWAHTPHGDHHSELNLVCLFQVGLSPLIRLPPPSNLTVCYQETCEFETGKEEKKKAPLYLERQNGTLYICKNKSIKQAILWAPPSVHL